MLQFLQKTKDKKPNLRPSCSFQSCKGLKNKILKMVQNEMFSSREKSNFKHMRGFEAEEGGRARTGCQLQK
jgi:hypothetical protein